MKYKIYETNSYIDNLKKIGIIKIDKFRNDVYKKIILKNDKCYIRNLIGSLYSMHIDLRSYSENYFSIIIYFLKIDNNIFILNFIRSRNNKKLGYDLIMKIEKILNNLHRNINFNINGVTNIELFTRLNHGLIEVNLHYTAKEKLNYIELQYVKNNVNNIRIPEMTGSEMKEIRTSFNLTEFQFAKITGSNITSIRTYEKNKSALPKTLNILLNLIKANGIEFVEGYLDLFEKTIEKK